MRFANNNKSIINKLTRKSIKANKLRNLFAISAIALTTILFTSLFTIGMGLKESIEQQTMRKVGGYDHVIAVLGACLLIGFSGYLIIFNIFQISVIKDIRFYGLLKTLGTTPKQIKTLVNKQALLLSGIGIPIGLIIGYLLGNVLLPVIIGTLNVTTCHISFSPVIFAGAAGFSMVTVFISCRKPGKIASRVSPIEAVRYVDAAFAGALRKKFWNGGKVPGMALANVLRNKRKTAVVIVSIALSLVLFNSLYAFTAGFDFNKYLTKFAVTDFTAANANYFNTNKSFQSGSDVVSEKMIDRISAFAGLEGSGRIYYNLKHCSTIINGKETYIQLYGLDDFPLSRLNIFEGKLDLEKLKTGNYIIEGVGADDNGTIEYETSNYDLGDKVTLTFENNRKKEYEVMAKAEIKHNLSVRYSLMGSSTMFLPAGEFSGQIKNPLTMSYVFNVKDKYIRQTERFLQDYTSGIEPQMDYESKQKLADQFKGLQNMFLFVGGTLSFIVGVIGILNFINAILTTIIARRREFAMLQSIGMTNQQLIQMLLLEGLFYAFAAIGCSLLLGSLLSFMIVRPIGNNLWFYSYKFSLLPILVTAPLLVLIALFIPFVSYKSNNKQTIVERLRLAE